MKNLTNNRNCNKQNQSKQAFVWSGLDFNTGLYNALSGNLHFSGKYGCMKMEKNITYYPCTPKEQLNLKVTKGIIMIIVSGHSKVLMKGAEIKINKLWENTRIRIISEEAVVRWNNETYITESIREECNLVDIDLYKNLN